MCLKGLVNATFGSLGHSGLMGVLVPSLHRESTDSLIGSLTWNCKLQKVPQTLTKT